MNTPDLNDNFSQQGVESQQSQAGLWHGKDDGAVVLKKLAKSRSERFRDKSELFQRAGLSRPSEVAQPSIVSAALQRVATKMLYVLRRFAGHIQTFGNSKTSLTKITAQHGIKVLCYAGTRLCLGCLQC